MTDSIDSINTGGIMSESPKKSPGKIKFWVIGVIILIVILVGGYFALAKFAPNYAESVYKILPKTVSRFLPEPVLSINHGEQNNIVEISPTSTPTPMPTAKPKIPSSYDEIIAAADDKLDSDGDGYPDYKEILQGYNPHKDEKKEAKQFNIAVCDDKKLYKTSISIGSYHNGNIFENLYWSSCISQQALKQDNLLICDRMLESGQPGKPIDHDECYRHLAEKRKSDVICDRLYTDDQKKSCHEALALINKNVNLCSKSTADCYLDFAKAYRDPAICDIKDFQTRDAKVNIAQCYNFMGNIKNDASYCSKAVNFDKNEGSKCYYNVALMSHNSNFCSNVKASIGYLYNNGVPAKVCQKNAPMQDNCVVKNKLPFTWCTYNSDLGKEVCGGGLGYFMNAEFSKQFQNVTYSKCFDQESAYSDSYTINKLRQKYSDAQIREPGFTWANGEEPQEIDAYFKAANQCPTCISPYSFK